MGDEVPCEYDEGAKIDSLSPGSADESELKTVVEAHPLRSCRYRSSSVMTSLPRSVYRRPVSFARVNVCVATGEHGADFASLASTGVKK